ncbi:hypothetical protein GE061_004136 [Apolygus lucorum]|uniref:Cilia- and flagella-associated protein 52 n=1 Tax=Apolygus lucorum TaxID=248454 RepID=A0A6A4J377_APOLU|nr:hypothetical protein GE061_004136 [Apolygus lucorum]
MSIEMEDIKDLTLRSIIGYDGNAMKGLKVHPGGNHMIYPFGIKVAIVNMETKIHRYLEGNTNVITSVAVSKTGKYVAAGQVNHMGFKAPVFVWDFETGEVKMTHESHKVRVENVAFSSCERYIISLGGKDDANVCVFDIETKDAICGTFSSNKNAGDAVTLGPLNSHNLCFISGGVYTLKVWTLDPAKRSASGSDVQMGKIRRKVTCIEVTDDDYYAWCGTSTGDVMKVTLNFSKSDRHDNYPVAAPALIGCFAKYARYKKRESDTDLWVSGVRSLVILPNNRLIIGSGDGMVELVGQKVFKPTHKIEKGAGITNPTNPLFVVLKSVCVGGLVTSMQLMNDKKSLLVGTIKCEMLVIDLDSFVAHLYLTCHTTAVYDIAFPSDYSDVFATASKNDVRVWSVSKSRELLRITVPNFTCSSLIFTHDGKSIVTGWNDGTVRGFAPQSGKHIYTITDAHNKGVSALGLTKDGRTLMTGGQEGQIRIWCVRKDVQKLIAVLKEHKGPVSSLQISPNDLEAASASTDGSCIIWDLVKCVRIAIMFSTTLFLCLRFHPSGCQLLTTGTNRQIGYWETFDGALIREIEGSRSAALNALDISSDGVYVASGGNDQYVKLWLYKEGVPIYIGLGHGAVITAVRISPDGRTVVSASADGAIFIWRSPTDPDCRGLSTQSSEEKKSEKSHPPSRASSKGSAGSREELDVKKELAKACKGMADAKAKLEKLKLERDEAEADVAKAKVEIEQATKLYEDHELGGAGDATVNAAAVEAIKCYCTGPCTCEKDYPPPTPKSAMEEKREEIVTCAEKDATLTKPE